jgi:transposase
VLKLDRDWEKLKIWMIKKKLEGQPVTDICSQIRVDRKVFYRWWNRYQTSGWSGLKEKPRGRPFGPDVDKVLKTKIIKLRARYEWGPKKIAGYLPQG